jgi:hypothetical protein
MKPIGSLLISASPFRTAGTTLDDGMKMPNWIPKHRAPFRCLAFSHIMKIPLDTWKFEVEDLPRIYAKVDRMLLDEGSGAVDVVDFIMGLDGRL